MTSTEKPRGSRQSGPRRAARSAARAGILLVDDHPANLMALEAVLEPLALPLLRASSGSEAVAIAEREDLLLVLLDLQMPELDGFETAALLRKTERSRAVPIIIVTADTPTRAEVARGYESGAVDFLFKPIEPDVLRSKVEAFVELHEKLATEPPIEEVAPDRISERLVAASDARRRAETAELEHRAIGARLRMALDAERDARAEAERASRAKDEFLATVSHELRNPLNAILGWSRVLLEERELDPDRLRRGLGVIARNAKAQVQLVEDILEVSRIVTGKLRLTKGPVDLTAAIEAAVEAIRSSAHASGVSVDACVDTELGIVEADEDRIQQVLWNLLSNALKFTPSGGRISVRAARVVDAIQIVVQDTGEGIEPEFLPHVFERFRQADGSTTRLHGGLGLGLAIVHHLVELHEGRVEAASEGKGRGARFTVCLPLRPAQVAAPSSRSPRARHAVAPLAAAPLAAKVVLVLDDEEDMRDLIAMILEHAGATVVRTTTVDEALARLAASAIDVAVSDLAMPGEDGYEFVRRARAKGVTLPLVAMTAHARAEDKHRVLEAGFTRHVAKPIEPAELVDVLRVLCSKK